VWATENARVENVAPECMGGKCESNKIELRSLNVIFARDIIYAKRAHAIAIPSVCPSVTRVDQSKTVEIRITQFSPYNKVYTRLYT